MAAKSGNFADVRAADDDGFLALTDHLPADGMAVSNELISRVTGQPVWPIEERPVPQSDVPGEKTSPTQPFPTKPPAYARNYVKLPDDVIDFTPELHAEALLQRADLLMTPDSGPMHIANAMGTNRVAGDRLDARAHPRIMVDAICACGCSGRRLASGRTWRGDVRCACCALARVACPTTARIRIMLPA